MHIELGGQDFYLDLLFYHLKLRCYIVVELKAGEFNPEYVSKLNMCQNIVNEHHGAPEFSQIRCTLKICIICSETSAA